MEGYKPTSTKLNLKFPEYPGLMILARGTTIGKLQKISGMKMTAREQDAEKVAYIFTFFATRIVTWNLTHPEVELDEEAPHDWDGTCPNCGLKEDQLLPTTAEGMYCLELSFILSLIFGWIKAVASAADPKAQNSSNGETSTHMAELMSQLAELQNLPT